MKTSRTNIKILSLMILVLFSSCNDIPTDISLPSWDSDFRIPITEKNYKLSEVIKLDNHITIDSNNSYLYKLVSDSYSDTYIPKDLGEGEFAFSYINNVFPVASKDTMIRIQTNNGSEIDSAIIKQGKIVVKIKNNSNDNVDFIIRVPALRDASTNEFKVSDKINANSNQTFEYDLANYSFSSYYQTSKNSIECLVKINGKFTGETIELDLQSDKVTFRYINGKIQSKNLDPLNKVFVLPIPADVNSLKDKLKLFDTKLFINADYYSAINNNKKIFEVILSNLRVIGKRKDGGEQKLKDQNGSENFGNLLIQNGTFSKEFNNSNSNISEFLSFIPDSLILRADVILNPNTKAGIATDNDSLVLKANFFALSTASMEDLNYSDTLDIEIDEKYRKEIAKAKKVKLTYQCDNEIPLGADLKVSYTDANYSSYFSQNISLAGANVLSNTQISNNQTKAFLELDSTQINQFTKSNYLILDWKLNSSKSAYKAFFGPNQKIKLKSWCEIKYHIEQ